VKEESVSGIKMNSLLNFRDLGEAFSGAEKSMKKGIVFRTANPDRLTRDDMQKLQSLNIRSVIDLRAPHEVDPKAVKIEGSQRFSLPLDFQGKTREKLKPVLRIKNYEEEVTKISQSLYVEMLDAAAPVFRNVLEILLQPDSYPAMIHCQVGKDRTGIISALLLLAMGADRQSVIADFMRSNDELIPFFRRSLMRRKILSFGFFPHKAVLFAVTVRKNNIEAVLDRVTEHYGGIEGYLSSSGFDVSQLPELRNRLCTN
jgi:protein-tyrosine phosphatase